MKIKKFREWLIQLGHLFSKPRSRNTVRKILLILFGFTFLIITYLLSFPYFGGDDYEYKFGERVKEDIKIFHDIRFPDAEKTKKARREAYEKVRYVFDRDYSIFNRIVEKLEEERFFPLKQDELSVANALKQMPFLRGSNGNDIRLLLSDKYRNQIIPWAQRYATEVFDRQLLGDLKNQVGRPEVGLFE